VEAAVGEASAFHTLSKKEAYKKLDPVTLQQWLNKLATTHSDSLVKHCRSQCAGLSCLLRSSFGFVVSHVQNGWGAYTNYHGENSFDCG
jgi:hypothetical protein